ncbi:MAG: 1-acyl-sn-glycerol-3-phosphate acyltransferase [Clostridiales bacterium]|jgi:1-acyl-sn-glycerol-3-phosphate acyltransferase|nr:1-acyl-sn-glycerol-3-phosphate acyltransferase [Clostridiales bacterium]
MLYPLVRAIAWVVLHLRCRVSSQGTENIPNTGGVVICGNHINWFDPVLIAVTTKRPIHFMGKKELFKNPLLKFFFKHINAFPIDRQATTDLKSLKTAISLLKGGAVLGIFAQGTRMKDSEVKSAKAGTAMFALKSGASIVPAGITGTYKWFSKVEVKYGKPITLEQYDSKKLRHEVLDEVTETVVESINELLKQ